jgi:hypothetical protein
MKPPAFANNAGQPLQRKQGTPAAPPVYRPTTASAAPPVYRPVVQARMAPPVYRPQAAQLPCGPPNTAVKQNSQPFSALQRKTASSPMPPPQMARNTGATKAQSLPSFGSGLSPLSGHGATIQRLTALVYNPVHDRPETDIIAAIRHRRVAHNGTQTMLAAYLSGYANQPGNVGGCKHYIPYAWIQTAVEDALANQGTLTNAVAWLNNLALPPAHTYNAGTLGNNVTWPVTVGTVPGINIQPASTNLGVDYYSEQVLDSEVDDLIFNLANDPRNLFYRPNSSGDAGGTQIDDPQGHGPIAVGVLRARLNGYRVFLQGLGLNV